MKSGLQGESQPRFELVGREVTGNGEVLPGSPNQRLSAKLDERIAMVDVAVLNLCGSAIVEVDLQLAGATVPFRCEVPHPSKNFPCARTAH